MNAFAIHFSYQFMAGVRNPAPMLLNYLFPIAFYVVMGLVMVEINPPFAGVLTPAMVTFTAMAGAVLGLPGQLVEAREAGVFRSFKINGVPALSILAVPALTTMVHALVVSGLVAATSSPLFDGASPTDWAALAGTAVLTIVCFSAIGSLIGVVSNSSRATVLWSQLVFLPSMLIGGMMVSLDQLPDTVRPVSKLLPSTYAMEAFRGLSFDQPTVISPGTALAVMAAGALAAAGLAVYLFSWDSQNAGRRGHPLLALLALLPYLVIAVI